jgi:hypothetical protein
MDDLEDRLRELGREAEFPPTPDLANSVSRELASRQRQAHRRGGTRRRFSLGLGARRAGVLAFAVFLATAGAVMAAPSSRHAVLSFFGVEGASIKHVSTLPEPPAHPTVLLGRKASLAQASDEARFHVLVPEALPRPDFVYFSRIAEGGQVQLGYRPTASIPPASQTGLGLLVTEFRADLTKNLVHKMFTNQTNVSRVRFGGRVGYWLQGAGHVVYYRLHGRDYVDTLRMATNTLVFNDGDVLVRIEASVPKAEAIRIAASLH